MAIMARAQSIALSSVGLAAFRSVPSSCALLRKGAGLRIKRCNIRPTGARNSADGSPSIAGQWLSMSEVSITCRNGAEGCDDRVKRMEKER